MYANDGIETLCAWNDYYLYVDVSVSCFVPDQCILDSDLPQIITIVIIILSITITIGVIVAGTVAAYKKGQEKALMKVLKKSLGSSSVSRSLDDHSVEQGLKMDFEETKDDKKEQIVIKPINETQTEDVDDDVKRDQPMSQETPSSNDLATTTKMQTFYQFCIYLPKEIMKKKSCYFPCITHLVDQATDFAVIFEFYQLYVFENIPNSNGTTNDCSGVNAEQLLILSCIAFLFYRIISCIWIYNITRSKFHTILQFFDLKIYHALYINFISEYNDGYPNTAQIYIQILEASLEAFPQVVIQLYFFIQVEMDIGKYWVIFASLIMSLYNVASKMASEDRVYFVKSWQSVFVGKCMINIRYLFRYIIRLCDVFQRIILILMLWVGIGGFYCALYIIFEIIVLSILSFLTKEYVANCT